MKIQMTIKAEDVANRSSANYEACSAFVLSGVEEIAARIRNHPTGSTKAKNSHIRALRRAAKQSIAACYNTSPEGWENIVKSFDNAATMWLTRGSEFVEK
jgi:hypothetical protein